MDTHVWFQDPSDPNSPSLFDTLVEASEGATAGGAIYAYASRPGIAMLFGDDGFAKFLRTASFDLVVGVDSITNTASLELLRDLGQQYAGTLVARAFLHTRRETFHPKFAWFRYEDGTGKTITGSGNLTPGGLFGNWEAFSITELGMAATETVVRQWHEWQRLHHDELLEVWHPSAMERAARNVFNIIQAPEVDEAPLVAPPPPVREHDVLVAEIPGRTNKRWGQANFNYDTFTTFFGVHPSKKRRVLLWHVDDTGALGPRESRPSVAVKSQNYRFELAAARGHQYPATGEPIAVFRRTGPRRFRYQLLFPADRHYATAATILDDLWDGPARRKRRVQLSSAELRVRWPSSPLL